MNNSIKIFTLIFLASTGLSSTLMTALEFEKITLEEHLSDFKMIHNTHEDSENTSSHSHEHEHGDGTESHSHSHNHEVVNTDNFSYLIQPRTQLKEPMTKTIQISNNFYSSNFILANHSKDIFRPPILEIV